MVFFKLGARVLGQEVPPPPPRHETKCIVSLLTTLQRARGGASGGEGEVRRGGGGHSGTERLPTAKRLNIRSVSGEHQNIGAVTSFERRKGARQLQTKHLIRKVTCKMCLFSLYFVRYMMFITLNALWNKIPKIGGGQRKLRGR